MRMWVYCRFTVSRYCRRMVSRLMAFTRETSMPDSSMLLQIDGILLTMVDSRTNFAKEIGALLRENYGSKIKVFASEMPKLIDSDAWGSASTTRTFFPA